MRSRLDTMTRLVAHAAAVVLLVLVWISVEPREAPPPFPAGAAPVPGVVAGQAAKIVVGEKTEPESTPLPLVWDESPAPAIAPGTKPAQPQETGAATVIEAAPSALHDALSPPAPVADSGSAPVAEPASSPAGDRPADSVAAPSPEPPVVPAEPEAAEPAMTTPQPATIDGDATPAPRSPAETPEATLETRVSEPAAPVSVPETKTTTPGAENGRPAAGETGADSAPAEPPAPAGDAARLDTAAITAITPGEPEAPAAAPHAEVSVTPSAPTSSPEPLPAQPDETGSLVVAQKDAGDAETATFPLPKDHGLEVLGENVFWAGSESELADKLERTPHDAHVVFLASAPDAETPGIGDFPAETIPATGDSLNADEAERFLRAVAAKPVVVAALSGAWGAAFFKGAYLMAARGMDIDAALAAIAPDLDKTGDRRDEIVHRLRRLDVDALKRFAAP